MKTKTAKRAPAMLRDGMRRPLKSRALLGGVQRVYRFSNGYGASVIRNNEPGELASVGNENGEGLWELCVLGGQDMDVCYETPIGCAPNKGIGSLGPGGVNAILAAIEALPKAET